MINRTKRQALFILTLVLAIGALSMVAARRLQALPQFYSGHVYNGASTRCLDSGTVANAQLWPCSTSVYQQWFYNPKNGQIVGNSPTGCLDDGAGTNGTGVPLVTCTGASSQKWFYDGSNRMVNQASGRCLDADLGTINQNGTKVQVWDCGSGTNQQWFFENEPQ
ncbi:MAG TPA: RICIN domain-containing protein [Thermoanaerobaculia bacterium]